MYWRIGCSGFYYKEWKEIFYPKGLLQKNWFEYYCSQFNTLEINSTFYAMPALKTLTSWHDKSPDDFLFSVKAPRLITHYKKFNDAGALVSDFYAVIKDGLQQKLGCVLFQLPPGYSYTEDRLNVLLRHLDPAFENVIEFRHESWWTTSVLKVLKENHISFCGISYPSSLPDEVIENNDPIYYRFHGKPMLYKSLYSLSEIKAFANQISPSKKRVFVYFNNTWGSSALINARQLQEIQIILKTNPQVL